MSDPGPDPGSVASAMPCPICRKPANARFRPFCSGRCAEVDLGRWLTESYRIPEPLADPDDPAPAPRDAAG